MSTELDIIDHPQVFTWLKDLSRQDTMAFVTLCGGNCDTFKSLWGKAHGKTQRFDYWKKEHLGTTIFVYTDKYTTFYKVQYLGEKEIFLQDKKIGAYVIAFLSRLAKELLP